jgi:hypothetical protein
MNEILSDLAAGRIDAAEASRRIDALKADERDTAGEANLEGGEAAAAPTSESEETSADAWASQTDRPSSASAREGGVESGPPSQRVGAEAPPTSGNGGGVKRISVRAVGRRVRIIGETAVATIAAEGPHVLRRNGSVMEVSSDGEMGFSLDGFSILRAPRSLDDIRALGLGKELFLRVNPNLLVDVEVTAGSLNTERVPHLGKVRVTAGSAKLLDVTEINDVLVQAGSATIKGAITSGRSRVRAESGTLSIHLADTSNVTVKGDAQLGKVSWSGGHSGAGDEVVMGNGAALLEVEVVMGHAQVRVGSVSQFETEV